MDHQARGKRGSEKRERERNAAQLLRAEPSDRPINRTSVDLLEHRSGSLDTRCAPNNLPRDLGRSISGLGSAQKVLDSRDFGRVDLVCSNEGELLVEEREKGGGAG